MAVSGRIQRKREANQEPQQYTTHDKSIEIENAEDNNNSGADDNPSIYSEVPRIAWEWIRWSGTKTFDGMDFAGEVLANFLGLNQSKYQWIIDTQQREEEKNQQRRLEKRQRRQLRLEQLLEAEQRKLQELESGALEQGE